MQNFAKIITVAAGGALGALARYGLSTSFPAAVSAVFPFATFFINVSGSLLLGFLLTLAAEKNVFGEQSRLFLTVGFLSAYTTFSAFEWETFAMAREGRIFHAAAYVFASLAAGLAGVSGGVWLARRF